MLRGKKKQDEQNLERWSGERDENKVSSSLYFLLPLPLFSFRLNARFFPPCLKLQSLTIAVWGVQCEQSPGVILIGKKRQVFEFMNCHLSGGKVWLRRTYEGELAKLEKAISKLATNDVKILGSYPGYLVRRSGSSEIRSWILIISSMLTNWWWGRKYKYI